MVFLSEVRVLFIENPVWFVLVVSALGLVVGSFLNVVIYRLPIMMQASWREQAGDILGVPYESASRGWTLVYPSSSCPSCNTPVRWHDNIPVMSYLLLRGRCRDCSEKISASYPFIEVMTAIVSGVLAYLIGPTWYLLAALVFYWGIVAAAGIDRHHKILPDVIVQPLLWLGLLVAYLEVGPLTLSEAFIGVLAGFLPLWLLKTAYGVIRGVEGLGDGDLKLFALVGAWLGSMAVLEVVLVSSLLQLAFVFIWFVVNRARSVGDTKDICFPFGPAISIAGVGCLIVSLA